jgi:hypothetical protein
MGRATMACLVLEGSECGTSGHLSSGPGRVVGAIAEDQADCIIIQGYIS